MSRSDYFPERCFTIVLRDARQLAWSEWGSESDQPVLFCTGAGMSSSLGFGANFLEQYKLRLIVVDRPGLGRSALDPLKTFESWNEDVRELCSHLRVESMPVIGFSQGAPFAYSLASCGIASRLTIVAGQDDFAYASTAAMLPGEVAGFVQQFREDNKDFIEGFAKIASAQGIWDLVSSMSSLSDKEFLANPDFATAYRRSLDEGFSAGNAGYIRDLQLTFGQWPFALEKIKVPVELWHGANDASAVHSPDFGATLAQRIQKCERHLLSNAGGFILWTHASEILRSLRG